MTEPEEDIPDWDEEEGWREEWEWNRLLRQRPQSTSRIQRSTEEWG
jgi:hypothetical protein